MRACSFTCFSKIVRATSSSPNNSGAAIEYQMLVPSRRVVTRPCPRRMLRCCDALDGSMARRCRISPTVQAARATEYLKDANAHRVSECPEASTCNSGGSRPDTGLKRLYGVVIAVACYRHRRASAVGQPDVIGRILLVYHPTKR